MADRLLGLRTTIYKVSDLAQAKAWYSKVLGIDPYFDEVYYVGFSVGGFELGLDPDVSASQPGPGGSLAYWGVDNMATVMATLKDLQVRVVTPPRNVGDGIVVAAVADPFGNEIGLIENPHYGKAAP